MSCWGRGRRDGADGRHGRGRGFGQAQSDICRRGARVRESPAWSLRAALRGPEVAWGGRAATWR
eukprot:1360937-Pleurochrysis_carterae.AAC.1